MPLPMNSLKQVPIDIGHRAGADQFRVAGEYSKRIRPALVRLTPDTRLQNVAVSRPPGVDRALSGCAMA